MGDGDGLGVGMLGLHLDPSLQVFDPLTFYLRLTWVEIWFTSLPSISVFSLLWGLLSLLFLRQDDRQSDTWLKFGVGAQWKAITQEFPSLKLQGGRNGSEGVTLPWFYTKYMMDSCRCSSEGSWRDLYRAEHTGC